MPYSRHTTPIWPDNMPSVDAIFHTHYTNMACLHALYRCHITDTPNMPGTDGFTLPHTSVRTVVWPLKWSNYIPRGHFQGLLLQYPQEEMSVMMSYTVKSRYIMSWIRETERTGSSNAGPATNTAQTLPECCQIRGESGNIAKPRLYCCSNCCSSSELSRTDI